MILGITGTPGAGKGTVVDYLVNNKKFTHISARAIWTVELEKRGLPIDRDHMTALANELRAEHGSDYFIRRALEMVSDASDSAVIESVRAIGEVDLLKQYNAPLLAVDADQKMRYERISGRGSALDDVTFEDFVRQEKAETENDDPNKQNLAQVIAAADYTIMNDGTLEELHEQIEAVLKQITEQSA